MLSKRNQPERFDSEVIQADWVFRRLRFIRCEQFADGSGMRALSIRQPYAELILRGIKTAELRSRATTIVGERFYIYASKKKWSVASDQWPANVWSDDLRVGTPPLWMIELTEQVKMIEPDLQKLGQAVASLPTGVIVGSAIIEKVTPPDPSDPAALFRWHLVEVQRAKHLIEPRLHPQPVWFNPF